MARQAQAGRIGAGTRLRRGLFILIIALLGDSTTLWAQAPRVPLSAMGAAAAAEPEASIVRILVGRSTVIDVGAPIARVSLTSADIADAMVTAPSQLLLNGKMPGTISMFVWDRAGAIRRYEVTVQRDLSKLNDQLHSLFPGEPIVVQSTGKAIAVSGAVSSKDVMDKALDLAGGYVEKKDELVNLMKLQENAASNQVLLRVRFAEVSRSAMTELATSFAANGYNNGRWFGRSTTEQFPAPQWDSTGKFVFSDFLNLFLFDSKKELAGVVRALQTKGLFQSLAEPNLVAESGKEASFLAGGEFPVPIATPNNGGITITIVFKEFGIRLTFTPQINGDRVHLKVKPEVSTLDFTNAITLQGFRIPALSTRRTETELELQDGQTFAIAGLMNNTMTSSLQKIPGIGDIPILGLLFKSKAAQKDQTELVVMITPQILPRNSRGVSSSLPRTPEPFLQPLPDKKTIEPLPPAFEPGRRGDPAAGGGPNPQVPKPAQATKPASSKPSASSKQSPADAAHAVSALTPGAPKAMPAAAAGPGSATTAPAGETPATRPLTPSEQKTIERARRDEQERLKATQAAQQKLLAKQAEQDRRRVEQERIEQQQLMKEKAKRDAAEAKLKEEKAKRDAEASRQQAEIDKKHQKAIEEAAAKLKAAEAAYQAEVAKKSKEKQDKQDKQ